MPPPPSLTRRQYNLLHESKARFQYAMLNAAGQRFDRVHVSAIIIRDSASSHVGDSNQGGQGTGPLLLTSSELLVLTPCSSPTPSSSSIITDAQGNPGPAVAAPTITNPPPFPPCFFPSEDPASPKVPLGELEATDISVLDAVARVVHAQTGLSTVPGHIHLRVEGQLGDRTFTTGHPEGVPGETPQRNWLRTTYLVRVVTGAEGENEGRDNGWVDLPNVAEQEGADLRAAALQLLRGPMPDWALWTDETRARNPDCLQVSEEIRALILEAFGRYSAAI